VIKLWPRYYDYWH